MKLHPRAAALIPLGLCASGMALASEGVFQLEHATSGGSACPQGSLHLTEYAGSDDLGRDHGASLLIADFDSFASHVQADAEQQSLAACALSIPFQAPAGKRLVLSDVQAYGVGYLSGRSELSFALLSRLIGTASQRVQESYRADPQAASPFLILLQKEGETHRSGCGEAGIAGATLSGALRAGRGYDGEAVLKIFNLQMTAKLEDCAN